MTQFYFPGATTIVENLKAALPVLEAVPEEQFELATFYCEAGCGTLACAAGWLAIHLRGAGALSPVVNLQDLAARLALDDAQFGLDAYDELFASRGDGLHDDDICDILGDEISDKELAIERMRRRITVLEAA